MQVKDLFEKIGENIGNSKDEVTKRVVGALVEREVASRTDACLALIAKLEELKKAAKKIKPDIEQFAVEDGVPAMKPTLSYSKAKAEELKKNADEQKKIEDALNKALQDGDFTKAKELSAKGGKPSPSANEDA